METILRAVKYATAASSDQYLLHRPPLSLHLSHVWVAKPTFCLAAHIWIASTANHTAIGLILILWNTRPHCSIPVSLLRSDLPVLTTSVLRSGTQAHSYTFAWVIWVTGGLRKLPVVFTQRGWGVFTGSAGRQNVGWLTIPPLTTPTALLRYCFSFSHKHTLWFQCWLMTKTLCVHAH